MISTRTVNTIVNEKIYRLIHTASNSRQASHLSTEPPLPRQNQHSCSSGLRLTLLLNSILPF